MRPASLLCANGGVVRRPNQFRLGTDFTSRRGCSAHDVPSAQTEVWVTVPVTSNSNDSHERDKGDDELGGICSSKQRSPQGPRRNVVKDNGQGSSPSQTIAVMPPETTRSMLLGMCTTWVASACCCKVASSSIQLVNQRDFLLNTDRHRGKMKVLETKCASVAPNSSGGRQRAV